MYNLAHENEHRTQRPVIVKKTTIFYGRIMINIVRNYCTTNLNRMKFDQKINERTQH